MNVEQRDAANAKITKNQNTIDLLTYFPIWEENGKTLTSEEKENIENEVESLNEELSKTEMHFEKLEILENEFEAELDFAVNQQLPESARLVSAADHKINFSMPDKSFFELDENNKLIEKEPYLRRINLDKTKQRYIDVEINSKRRMGVVRGVAELRNHFYLKFSPFGVSSKDELELIVEFFNNASKAEHTEKIKLKGSRVEERFYQRKTLKDKRVIHYGKGTDEKCINMAIGVRKWEDHRIQKQKLEKYQTRKKEINELLDESDRLRYKPGFSELTDAWEKHQNIILQMTRLNILYENDRKHSNREIPEIFRPRTETDERETGSDQNENFLMPSRRGHAGRFSQCAPVYQSITSKPTNSNFTLEKLASKTAKIARKYQSYSIQKTEEPTEKPKKLKELQKSKNDKKLAKLQNQLDDLEKAYELTKTIPAKSSRKTKKKPKTPKDKLFRFARNELPAVRPLPPSEAMMLKLEFVQLRMAINKKVLDCLFNK